MDIFAVHRHDLDIEEVRAFKEALGLSDLGYSQICDVKSHVTVAKLKSENPAISLSSLRQLQAPLPRQKLWRSTAFDGQYSQNRKVILAGDLALQADRDLVRCSLAAGLTGDPLETEGLAYHIIEPKEPVENSVFIRWQPVPGVDGGADFTSSLLADTPDPAIREEFKNDVLAVLNTLSAQFGILHRKRINPRSGEISYRLFMRIMSPYIGKDDTLRVFVITRPQKIEPTLALFPDLRLSAPD